MAEKISNSKAAEMLSGFMDGLGENSLRKISALSQRESSVPDVVGFLQREREAAGSNAVSRSPLPDESACGGAENLRENGFSADIDSYAIARAVAKAANEMSMQFNTKLVR